MRIASVSPSLRRLITSAAGVLVIALVAGGCSTISVFVDLQSELDRAGFSHIGVNIDTGDRAGDSVRVRAGAPPGLDVAHAQNRAAEITWKTFGRRFDRVTVSISGSSRTYDRAGLSEQFGPRPASLDDKKLGDDVRRIGVGVVIALAGGAILCVGLIVVVLLLVRRSRRKKRLAAPQWPGQGPWGETPVAGGYAAPAYPPPAGSPPANRVPPGWE